MMLIMILNNMCPICLTALVAALFAAIGAAFGIKAKKEKKCCCRKNNLSTSEIANECNCK